ncbi:MAG: NAD(+)--rifampin ADP-ribosyltransferase [Parvularcula sp.]|jgi:rifampin ADP-ribosylating transferase|nr:NAD(+)--rifampin ADP-ribosyltransferase [Parvularcula sp.]
MSATAKPFAQSFFHGTKADLKIGDVVKVGHASNFLETGALSWVYFTATLDAAVWGAELSGGDGLGRIYIVEPTGPFEDDPNVTDKRFPGNPTLSYRSREPLRIVAEATHWQGHTADQILQMKQGLERLTAEGANVILD